MADFAKFLRESGKQSELDRIRSIPGGFEKAAAEFNRGTGQFASSAKAGQVTQNFQDIARQTLKLQREANQPAVEALQSTVPNIERSFEQRGQQLQAQKQPLQDRYKALLDEIKFREGRELQTTATAQSREFGKRGIPLSSGAFQQSLKTAQRPTREFFTGQVTQAGLAQEQSQRELGDLISNLPIERQKAVNDVTKAVAALQSGASSTAVQNALSILQQQQGAEQFQQNFQLAQAELQLSQRQFESGEARSAATDPLQLALLQAQIDKTNRSGTATASTDITSGLQSLLQQFGG